MTQRLIAINGSGTLYPKTQSKDLVRYLLSWTCRLVKI